MTSLIALDNEGDLLMMPQNDRQKEFRCFEYTKLGMELQPDDAILRLSSFPSYD